MPRFCSKPDIRVDFIARAPQELAEIILEHVTALDHQYPPDGFMCNCCLVSKAWNRVISHSRIWKKFAEKDGYVQIDEYDPNSGQTPKEFYNGLKNRLLTLSKSTGLSEVLVPLKEVHPEVCTANFIIYDQGKVILGTVFKPSKDNLILSVSVRKK